MTKTYINDEDDIVTLMADDGTEIDFIEIAGIAYNGGFYAVLQPVELLEGMQDDEALVFSVGKNADGSDIFEVETDEEVIEGVFAEYQKLLDKLEEEE